ncbi:MAG TPA: hypothetical protein VD813_14760 [Pseudonocardia sp.]|nr:hypothetical protein [Pseudonocardia sp.]
MAWWSVTDPVLLPPGPLPLRLDGFPTGQAVSPTQTQVDRVAFYPLSGVAG